MPPKRKRSAAAEAAAARNSDDDDALLAYADALPSSQSSTSSLESAPAPAPAPAKRKTTTTATATKKKNVRKPVLLAEDADDVLQACRNLKAKLRTKASQKRKAVGAKKRPSSEDSDYNSDDSSDDELDDETLQALITNDDDDKKKKEGAMVVSPGNDSRLKNIIEVAELNPTEVLEGMETIALGIANQVLNKQGFSMAVPSRAASNQIYVQAWDRIVLGHKTSSRNFLHVKDARKSAVTLRVMQLLHAVLVKRIHITKRDLFYTDVKLFVNQMDSDGVLDDVATMVGCTRSNLHVVASDKGLVVRTRQCFALLYCSLC